MQPNSSPSKPTRDQATRVQTWVTIILVLIMAAELVAVIFEGQRLTAFLVCTIIILTVAPVVLGPRLPVKVPTEFQLLTVLFVFAALFLGEIRDYYGRIWWWDMALHASSGLLLGILGFMLVYVLNEHEHVELHLLPRFVAIFAFLFAVTIGALWEIFEFGMDRLFQTNMQKPMLGDPSGLTDTMWDLIVDSLGALFISVFGWWYMRSPKSSFIENWIEKFLDRNPDLFRH